MRRYNCFVGKNGQAYFYVEGKRVTKEVYETNQMIDSRCRCCGRI